MEDKNKIAIAKDWVSKLANGINPLNGNAVKDDDIVNNVHISRCLFYVADILEKYSERKVRNNSTRNIPFDLSSVQKEKYNYVDATSISAFARQIQSLIPENMQAVGYKSMTQWLIQSGFLIDSEPDKNGRTFKTPTENGKKIGIYSEERNGESGHYFVTLYNREAQRFLLEHLEEMSNIAL